MQEPDEIEVSEFEWDDDNISHCSRHNVTPSLAEVVKDRQPKFFRNKEERTGTHVMVGPDEGERFWTIIILPTVKSGRWRPITGWPSDKPEIKMYMDAME